MPLSRYERKERLPYGAQKEIARELGLDEATVSRVNNDRVWELKDSTVRRVRVAIARRLRMKVAEAFDLNQQVAA